MATIKLKFRASSIAQREGVLFYQVIHNRVSRQIHTGYKVYEWEWDRIHSEIVFPSGIGEERRLYLLSLRTVLAGGMSRLNGIIARLEYAGVFYTADKVVSLYASREDCTCFISFAGSLISQLQQIGKKRTAETYTTVLNSFVRFMNGGDVPLDEFDSVLMVKYEGWLRSTGVCPNTTSFYIRNLRAVYNRAVDSDLVIRRNPFKHVYTGIDKTVKRAVSLEIIRRIRDLELVSNPSMDLARDLFMFSFYTRGMSFIDMAFLKKSDLKNGILSYRRQKTGQQLFIKWEKPMQEIIDKYDTTGTAYLLPVIQDTVRDERRQYKNAVHLVNDKLKRIGKKLGLGIPLTTYVARHAWASIAQSKHIPISIISEAMGHDSEVTTRIYLASLDTSVVDKANSMILKSI